MHGAGLLVGALDLAQTGVQDSLRRHREAVPGRLQGQGRAQGRMLDPRQDWGQMRQARRQELQQRQLAQGQRQE